MLVFTYYYLCLWCWISSIHVKAANDTMKPGDSLSSSDELCSQNGTYCIAFNGPFAAGLIYLTIYSNMTDNWRVWIANRNQPVVYFNNSAFNILLELDYSGALKIESQDREPIILYSPPPPPPQAAGNNNTVVATIKETGNFVVQQLNPDGSVNSVLWQSFDHPTDSLLPGMKLGIVNHKTGHNLSLVSWLAGTYPAPGPFSLEWEPNELELIIRRRGQEIWRSGKLRDNKFEHISEDSHRVYYTIVSNEDEDTFTIATSIKERTRWVIMETGQLVGLKGTWIARADLCYGYNTDGGCQRWEIPTCRYPGDVFEKQTGSLNFSGNGISYETNTTSYGIGDCQAICWSNCSCTGFMSLTDYDTGCIYFSGKSLDGVTLNDTGRMFYKLVKKPPQPVKKPQHRGMKMWIWISVVVATVLLAICSSTLCLAINKRKHVLKDKRRKIMKTGIQDSTAFDESTSIEDFEDDLNKGHDFKVFSYASIMEATSNFSSENKLGQGGFGPVYKGILTTGQEVAVKRLSKTSGQGIVEFKNELKLICELQHVNLVQLLGCCIQEHERMLIYEYMPNKSLDFFLFDNIGSKFLNWQKRINIIEGICQGLLYLHNYSRLKIIHRDLKASNILLDDNMNPKISDFGMARMFTQQESTINTKRIVGTYGYMAPEYAMEGIFSTKSDVYSFGVLLLEIVSGRRNNSFYDADHPLNLVGHAWELWNKGESLKLMDPSLNDTFVQDEVQRCIHVGLLCVEHYAKDRPNMLDIVSIITNKSAAVTMPRGPAFYVGRQTFEGEMFSKSAEFDIDSTKEISTSTEVEAK
ncbi:hypothetical protein RIF29_30710 [Crotalaria pallida]|uniref:Receptor-like serine/threonine-protein kinase n=1 Tax=Crotalaria pallida TaxID=3830 RepID=A0AAN9EGU4_CROPI